LVGYCLHVAVHALEIFEVCA